METKAVTNQATVHNVMIDFNKASNYQQDIRDRIEQLEADRPNITAAEFDQRHKLITSSNMCENSRQRELHELVKTAHLMFKMHGTK